VGCNIQTEYETSVQDSSMTKGVVIKMRRRRRLRLTAGSRCCFARFAPRRRDAETGGESPASGAGLIPEPEPDRDRRKFFITLRQPLSTRGMDEKWLPRRPGAIPFAARP
jgi:hypothetical protein